MPFYLLEAKESKFHSPHPPPLPLSTQMRQ